MRFAVYVHFPYCAARCPYCDFAVAVEREIPQARVTRALLVELALRAPAFEGLACASVYLGGGTPSLWDPDRVAEVLEAVRARFSPPPGAEITLEVNPEGAELARLRAYAAAGVNRFSVGVQSFDPAVLAKLGRRHGPVASERAIRAAADCVENVAVDLIQGGRRSTVASARGDAERIASLPVTHVSAYALTVDAESLGEETPFARMRGAGRLPLPPDEEVVDQARAARAVLRRAGFRRYEISNFARPGFASVHNRLYWASESYLGIGVGAFGCLHQGPGQAVRQGNHRTPAAWFAALDAGGLPVAEEDLLGPPELARERLLLGLRTREGLSLSAVSPERQGEVRALVKARLAAVAGERLVLTSRGMDLHSAVVERLLP